MEWWREARFGTFSHLGLYAPFLPVNGMAKPAMRNGFAQSPGYLSIFMIRWLTNLIL